MSNYFLIGFMGCGKSRIGKAFAKLIGYHFIDIDKEIEKKEQMPIAEIFLKKGEAYFRELEHDFLKELSIEKKVVSTGGGLPCFHTNMELLNQKGESIYLKRPIDDLIQILSVSKAKRPLLEGLDEIAKEEQIKTLFNAREANYELATHTLSLLAYEHSERAALKLVKKLDINLSL